MLPNWLSLVIVQGGISRLLYRVSFFFLFCYKKKNHTHTHTHPRKQWRIFIILIIIIIVVMLAQRGHEDVLKGQILMYPVLALERQDFDSYQTYGDGDYFISRKNCDYFYQAYCGEAPFPADVRLAPLLATLDELKSVPKALILTAECDVLRDEGEAYARKLTQAGVDTCCVRIIGATHGYATAPPNTSHYRRALHMMTDFLTKDAFGN
jgi:acetyl esterase